ncbi:MAG: DUF4160 domain-containing protein [Deltaproteobacteria bacterium]|nr:DUF4160 domain-containing protein [Deltaproteobacteria bacterium]MBI4224578.1 DUF4160 domain-containing protein [Deltaproteobacteria bacterium]
MPTVFRKGPYRFFFFSNEGFEPKHIHVESGDQYAKFWIKPVALAKSIGYNGTELNRLSLLVKENEKLFEEKWNEYFGG